MRYLLIAWLAWYLPGAIAEPVYKQDIDVKVDFVGDEVHVDVSLLVPATPDEVWVVITDYDHATDFISDLQSSQIVSRSGDTLQVMQKGKMRIGPFTFPVETLREIQLVPFSEMRARLISGNMKKLVTTTRLTVEGTFTRIFNRAESIPEFWVPPLIGKLFIRHETRDKFQQLRDEILRRKRAAEAR
jgi:hypothetical protein